MSAKKRARDLRALMDARNLTAAGVAMRIGNSPNTVRAWLRGSRNMPESQLRLLKLLLQG